MVLGFDPLIAVFEVYKDRVLIIYTVHWSLPKVDALVLDFPILILLDIYLQK